MDIKKFISKYEELLKEQGKTKSEMYATCGFSSSAVSQWKRGDTSPSLGTLERIAVFLKVPVSALIEDEIKKDPSVMSDEEVDAELYEILSALKDRPELRALFRAAQGTDADNVRRVADLLDGFKNK